MNGGIMNDYMTVTLNNGRIALAKMYAGKPTALGYANRTQAYKKLEAVGDGWAVTGSRPWFITRTSQERI